MSKLSERLRLTGLESWANEAFDLEAENAELRAKLFGLPEAFSVVVDDLKIAEAKLEAMERKRDLYAQLATFYSAKLMVTGQPPDYGLAIYALRDLPLTEEFQLRDLAWAHHREGYTCISDWEYFRDEWVERWRLAAVAQQEKEDE